MREVGPVRASGEGAVLRSWTRRARVRKLTSELPIGLPLTSGADRGSPEARPTRGEAIAFVRARLHRDEHGQAFTQAGLYRRCRELADADGVTGRIYFSTVDDDNYRAKKMRALEKGRDIASPYDLGLVARAFNLPDHFFLGPWASLEEVEESWAAARDARRKPPSEQAVPPPPGSARGFRLINDQLKVSSTAYELAHWLTAAIDRRRPANTLVLIEGRTWAGKSEFANIWFRDFHRPRIGGHALRVDCSESTPGQIAATVEAHFASVAESQGGEAPAAFAVQGPKLIVLDKLRMDQFAEGPVLGAAQRPHFRELVEAAARPLEHGSDVTVIMLLENNGARIEEFYFNRSLDQSVGFVRRTLPPLSDAEGARLLSDLGVSRVSESARREISRRAHGLPLGLRAAAEELVRLSPPEQERYLDALIWPDALKLPEVGAAEAFGRYFRKHLQRIAGPDDSPDSETHPVAMMRLLSVMPGGAIAVDDLAELLEFRRIARLRQMSVEALGRGEVPFVRVSDGRVELQSRAALLLKRQIDEEIASDRFPSFASRTEFEWIHWKCAMQAWRTVGGLAAEEVDAFSIAAIEAFVHHVCALIRLVPTEGSGASRHTRKMPGGVNARTVEEFLKGPGRLSDAQMWMLAYQQVVNRFLLRGRASQSRIHGQYEAKARIIGRLLSEAESRIQAPPNDRIELLRELAVSWMQSGRLHSAREACDRAEREIAKLAGWSGDPAAVSPREPSLWRHFCDVRSLRMAIDLRYGRPVDVVTDGLGPVVDKAREIAARRSRDADPVREGQAPSVEAGAIRILARTAEVALNAGDVERAIDLFESVDALTAAIRGRAIEGDAAREFAIALVRARGGAPDRLRRAEALIDSNVTNLQTRRDGSGPSIDLIRFLILKASLRRIAGDLDGAESVLAAAEGHDYVRSGKCTYITYSKLGLERLRMDIAAGRTERSLNETAAALGARVLETNHLRLHHEMLLVHAEIADRDERARLLEAARAFMRGRGWMLRRADADLIERGGSAVLEFGL